MNSIIIIRMLLVFILCLSVNMTSIIAVDKNLLQPNYTWSSTEYVQGTTDGSVTIKLVSSSLQDLTVSWVGLRFMWMDQNLYYPKDYSGIGDLPIGVKGTADFGIFHFSVPLYAHTGSNAVEFKIYYKELGSSGWSYTQSLTFTTHIMIVDALQQSYAIELAEVDLELTSANNANYSSPLALSYIRSAENEYTTALTFAISGLYTDAIAHLNLASNALSQANATETEYLQLQEELQNQETVLREKIRSQNATITQQEEFIKQLKETIIQQDESIKQQGEKIKQRDDTIKQLQQTTLIIEGLLGIAILGIIVFYFVYNNARARDSKRVT